MPDLASILQGSLFAGGEPFLQPTPADVTRRHLDDDCWVDTAAGWLHGSDLFFGQLATGLSWQHRTVPMYDRMVREPRLVWGWHAISGVSLPSPLLEQMRRNLSALYGIDLTSVGCNFYRDGHDSVAWHGDRVAGQPAEPVVATVSVGAARPFLLRPLGGGPSHAYLLGHGDLLVMGGRCQEQWQHTVPKVARAGPRISIVFRSGQRVDPRAVHPAGSARNRAQSSQLRNRVATECHHSSPWGSGVTASGPTERSTS